MNFLDATVESTGGGRALAVLGGGHRLELAVEPGIESSMSISIGVRPQHVKIGDGPASLAATVRLVEGLGAETVIHTDVAGQKVLVVAAGQHSFDPGTEIRLSLADAPLHVFDDKGLRH
jgi:ABC-type sugar transport system ATPase subunit